MNTHAGDEAPVAGMNFTTVADDVVVGISDIGGWFVGNAGWIEGPEAMLAVDACVSERRTRLLLDGQRELRRYPDAPVTLVVTHEHGDHVNGAYLFEEAGAEVVASPYTVDTIMTNGVRTYPGFLASPQWGGVRAPRSMRPLVEAERVDLGGGRVVQILPVPGVGHTCGDLVVWDETTRCLFIGDLVFNEVTPLTISGSIDGWLAALDWAQELDPAVVVPGHGAIGGPEVFDPVRQYLLWCKEAGAAVADGATLDEAQASRPEGWQHWECGERDWANLMRAAADHRGEPLDFQAALEVIVEVRGGLIVVPG